MKKKLSVCGCSFGGDDDEYATAESSGRRKASGSTQKHVNKPFAMLQNEISILKECKSPFVTRYYRSHEKISSFWIVMEFFDFGSVHDILKVRNAARASTCLGKGLAGRVASVHAFCLCSAGVARARLS